MTVLGRCADKGVYNRLKSRKDKVCSIIRNVTNGSISSTLGIAVKSLSVDAKRMLVDSLICDAGPAKEKPHFP